MHSSDIKGSDKEKNEKSIFTRILGFLLPLFIIAFFISIPLSYLFDLNIASIWSYPIYMLLDDFSDHLFIRYIILFPLTIFFATLATILILVIVYALLSLARNKHILKKAVCILIGIIVYAALLVYGVSILKSEYDVMHNEQEYTMDIAANDVDRKKTNKQGYRFRAVVEDSSGKETTLSFTSYQYYNIRSSREKGQAKTLRVYYSEFPVYGKKVFRYEVID